MRKSAKELWKQGDRKPETKKRYKDEILTELYSSGVMQDKIDRICWHNRIKRETKIAEDLIQETFMHLSKRKEDELIEMYEDNPSRIIGLAVTIAVRKGVLTHKQYPNYPKHSLAKFILFTSNLNTPDTLDVGESFDESAPSSEFTHVLVDQSTEEDPEQELWELIRSELTEEENTFLEYLLNMKKGRGRYKVQMLEKIKHLKNRIREIIRKHKINI